MKINLASLAFALMLPLAVSAQEDSQETFNSGSQNITRFNSEAKKYNDWSISIGGGTAIMQAADLTSIKNGNGKNQFGYSYFLSVNKSITHLFGLNLQYDRAQTYQGLVDIRDKVPGIAARTEFHSISLLGDINISNMLRRSDNMSPYRWALHAYGGVGTIGYKTYGQLSPTVVGEYLGEDVQLGLGSWYMQTGGGLKYKLNNRIDIEGRIMYVISGDDEFDGGGTKYSPINVTEDQVSDNAMIANIGVTLNLGKHKSHLMWHDPLQEVYYKLDDLANQNQAIEVCKKGDQDNDGVCDDWDKELTTPVGARVDGSGISLDTDLDGVIDLNDNCVVVPGEGSADGCPAPRIMLAPEPLVESLGDNESIAVAATEALKNLLFDTNKSTIRKESNVKLDNAAEIIKKSTGKYKIEGHTDSDGSDASNLKLSKARAAAVVKALEKRGVPVGVLVSEGFGETKPACDNTTPEGKQCNRRVEVSTVN